MKSFKLHVEQMKIDRSINEIKQIVLCLRIDIFITLLLIKSNSQTCLWHVHLSQLVLTT